MQINRIKEFEVEEPYELKVVLSYLIISDALKSKKVKFLFRNSFVTQK